MGPAITVVIGAAVTEYLRTRRYGFLRWGTRIRTLIARVRVWCPAIGRSPTEQLRYFTARGGQLRHTSTAAGGTYLAAGRLSSAESESHPAGQLCRAKPGRHVGDTAQ